MFRSSRKQATGRRGVSTSGSEAAAGEVIQAGRWARVPSGCSTTK
jgi:hypothetical protein